MKILLSEMENPRRRSIVAPWLMLSAAVLVCVSIAHAQTTTINGTLTDAFGSSALRATCGFRSGAVFSNSGGYTVMGTAAPRTVTVTNGALSVALVPTPTGQYVEMRCHIPLQTLAGVSCEGNSSLVSQGVCVEGPGDAGPLYLTVPSSGPVALKDIMAPTKPTAVATCGTGDLAGTAPLCRVEGIAGVPLCNGFTPTNGQVLQYTTANTPNPCYTAAAAGAVTSVFSRTGSVAAQSGDYSAFYEPTIAAGTNAQYWRGDKTWQSLAGAALAAMAGLYEVPLTFGSGLTRSTNTITLSAALPQNTTSTAHQFFTGYNSTTGAFTKAQPAAADLSDGTTGTGAVVLANSPGITNPDLGGTALSNTVTAGTGGVTSGHVVQKTTDNPTRYVNATSATAQIKGIARTTASATATFQLATTGIVGCVLEGAGTAGHYWTYGVSDPSKCKDTASAALSTISNSVRLGGVLQASGTDGQTVSVSVFQNSSGGQIDTLTNPVITGIATIGAPVPNSDGATHLVNSENGFYENGIKLVTGGGGAGSVYTTVTYSATPTYMVNTSAIQVFQITLTGNITSATLNTSLATQGQYIVWRYCQDAVGGRIPAWPPNVYGYGIVDTTANACSAQAFAWDGTANAVAVGQMQSDSVGAGLLTSGGLLSLPVGPDTLVARTSTDTLTNKTIDCANNTCSIRSADLPNPGASAGGKVRSTTCSAGSHISAINTDSTVTCSADTAGTDQRIVRMEFHAGALVSSTSTRSYAAFIPNAYSVGSNGNTYAIQCPITGTIVSAAVTILNTANSTAPGGDTNISLCINGTNAGCTSTGASLVSLWTGNMPAATVVRTSVTGLSQACTVGQTLDIGVLPGTYTTNAVLAVIIDAVMQ